jgi:hypothetical protein
MKNPSNHSNASNGFAYGNSEAVQFACIGVHWRLQVRLNRPASGLAARGIAG